MDPGLQAQPQELAPEQQQPVPDSDDQLNTPTLSGTLGEQTEEAPQAAPFQSPVGHISGLPAVKDEYTPDPQDQKLNVTAPNTPPSAPEPPKAKLTETELLRERLKRDPLDASAHQRLIGLAEASGDVEKIQEAYEGLLEAFPNAVCCLVPV